MIDFRLKQGENLALEVIVSYENPQELDPSTLSVAARLCKGFGGIAVQDLTVTALNTVTSNGVSVTTLEITATAAQTATWPAGVLSFDVKCTWQGETVISRSVNVYMVEAEA